MDFMTQRVWFGNSLARATPILGVTLRVHIRPKKCVTLPSLYRAESYLVQTDLESIPSEINRGPRISQKLREIFVGTRFIEISPPIPTGVLRIYDEYPVHSHPGRC